MVMSCNTTAERLADEYICCLWRGTSDSHLARLPNRA